MVANYTAQKKPHSDDPYAPGGKAGGRPDRAVTVYCNLIRKVYGKGAFIVAGGLEASLRKFAHYDYWSDSVRRPLLMDCGASILVHGMGEGPIMKIARRIDRLDAGNRRITSEELVRSVNDIPGVVYRTPKREPEPKGVELPLAEKVACDSLAHARAYHIQEINRDKLQWQNCGGMRVIANPPWMPSSQAEIDRIFDLSFTRDPHPMYGKTRIPALESVRFSITTHRGCFGGCAFCAIGAHQGKTIHSRSKAAILREVKRMVEHPAFRGTISDVGGPTANMWELGCKLPTSCNRVSCLWPAQCKNLNADQKPYLDLLKEAGKVPGVKHLFVSTGIRMDLALSYEPLITALALEHTSGELKVAPEHISPSVLHLMRKPAGNEFRVFLEKHRALSKRAGKKQFVLPYFIAAHPGCAVGDMLELAEFLKREKIIVEQCQIFTPTPGTASTVMYATGLDPATLKPVYVEKDPIRKEMQKALILWHLPESRRLTEKLHRAESRDAKRRPLA